MQMKTSTPQTRCHLFLFLVFSILLIPYKGTAQSNMPLNYRVGLAANLPFVSSNTDTFSARTGWGVWGDAEYKVNNNIHFHPGLGYNNFGYFQNYTTDSGIAQRRRIIEHYFDLTGQLSYSPSAENSARFFIGLGVSLLAQRSASQPDILGINITQATLDDKKSFAPGFLLNAGFSAPLSKKIDLGLQYNLGLPNKIRPLDITGRLSSLQIRLSYKIMPNEGEPTKISSASNAYLPYKPDSLVIVVRLKENLQRIAILREGGNYAEANEEESNTREDNLAIVNAFKQKFTVMPVLFFYDNDSRQALTGNFEGILLNDDLKRDSNVQLPEKQYLFAEFARLFDETTQTSGMYGLVIYDDKFKNINTPFPAFTSNAYGFLNTGEVITKFQKKLVKYFNQK